MAQLECVVRAGVRDIGENRLQEALPKISALEAYRDLRWHFIGALQRRKVKSVVGTFVLIQSVDSVPLAEEISRRAEARGLRQRVLLEVNLGGEPTKAGFGPAELPGVVPDLARLSGLRIEGLMAVPPYSPVAEATRPYFRRLRELAESARSLALARALGDGTGFEALSMGMSEDYEIAVEEGATMVRVGRAIFGSRDA